MHKECKKLIKTARQQGWEERQGGKHATILVPPDGSRLIPIAHSPTTRGLRNKIAQLRRAGLEV